MDLPPSGALPSTLNDTLSAENAKQNVRKKVQLHNADHIVLVQASRHGWSSLVFFELPLPAVARTKVERNFLAFLRQKTQNLNNLYQGPLITFLRSMFHH